MVKLLSGSSIQIYSAATATAAPTIGAADGAIPTTGWDLVAEGEYDDNVTIENTDERTDLRFQGSKGRISEQRRTSTGLMISAVAMNTTPQLAALAYGTSVTTTAAASGQVGIHAQNFDLPLKVPEYAWLAVIDSPFDEDGSEGWKGYIYIPKGTAMIGAFNGAVDPEGTSLEIRQLDHATAASWQLVFADAMP